MAAERGTLFLLGGQEVGSALLGEAILGSVSGNHVAVIPTASAFEGPEEAVVRIAAWLVSLGAEVEGLMVISRADAELEEMASRLDEASIGYVSDGTALHLRTTLKATALFASLLSMLEQGKTVVAAGASATVLCDPMIDPRGGAPTVGLGPIRSFTVVPHIGYGDDDPRHEQLQRTIALASAKIPVVTLPIGTGLRCRPDGTYDVLGTGDVTVYSDGSAVGDGVAWLSPWWEVAS